MSEQKSMNSWIDPTGEPGLASILIPAYNAAETIATTLDSVAKQTYRPIEVILINDGSTDQTDILIQNWVSSIGRQSDFIIRYLRQSNQGLLACRNRSTLECHGEFIQYLDADDLLHPEKCAMAVAAMRQNSSIDVHIPRTQVFFQDQEVVAKLDTSPAIRNWSDRETGAPMIARVFWYTLGPVFRRRVVAAAGPFPLDVHPVAEEIEFHTRIKCTSRSFSYSPEVIAFHRIGHPHQLTRQLPNLYKGKVDGSHRAAMIMEEHAITDPREWHYLIKDLVKTTYAIVACSYDQALFEEAYRLLKKLTKQHWSLMSWAFLLLGPQALAWTYKLVHSVRKEAPK